MAVAEGAKLISPRTAALYATVLVSPFCALLIGCGGQTGQEVGSVSLEPGDGTAAKEGKLNFGESCSAAAALDPGLCCCRDSGLVAYGRSQNSSSWCVDGVACTGSDTGFCSRRPHNGTAPYYIQATKSFCQFTCPCCEEIAVVATGTETHRLGPDSSKGVQPEDGAHPTRGAMLSQQWRGESIALFDVTNSSFHRNLLKNVNATYSLQEFHEARIEYPPWTAMSALRDRRNWTDGELAIYMYTTEVPLLYRPMNKMMREAQQMADIDVYWQSYMAILRDGLSSHTTYLDLSTYRGVDCDAADVLHLGEAGVLPSFTSTSAEIAVAEAFGCTVLHFSGGGYDLREYSQFPGEAEILMEQGRVYHVTQHETKSNNGPVHVHLETEPSAAVSAGHVPVSREAPRRSCQGLDPSQCEICRCCDRPPSSSELQQRSSKLDLAWRKRGLQRHGGLQAGGRAADGE